MKRREFLQNSILTIGGLMVGKNLLSDEANPDLVVVKGSNIY
jgi:hypothetical protein